MGPPAYEGVGPLSQTGKVFLCHYWSRIPQHDHQTWLSGLGPSQSSRNCRLALPGHCQIHTIIPGIHQFLPMIYSPLLQHCLTPPWPHQEDPSMELEQTVPECIPYPEECLYLPSCPPPAWLVCPLCHLCRHIKTCLWLSPPSGRHQWRMAPIYLSLLNVQPSWMELWHLWPWTHSHVCPRYLVTLPPWFSHHSPSLHQP